MQMRKICEWYKHLYSTTSERCTDTLIQIVDGMSTEMLILMQKKEMWMK